MAALTVNDIIATGNGLDSSALLVAAAGGGDTVKNSEGDVFLYVKNGGGATLTMTVTVQKPNTKVPGYGTLARASSVVNVGAGDEAMVGPFPTIAFNNSANDIAVTYNSATLVTIGAFRLPRDER